MPSLLKSLTFLSSIQEFIFNIQIFLFQVSFYLDRDKAKWTGNIFSVRIDINIHYSDIRV